MDLSKFTQQLLDSEEMQFYISHFGLRKDRTAELIKSWQKEKLKQEEQLILNKTSNLSRRERELVMYYAKRL